MIAFHRDTEQIEKDLETKFGINIEEAAKYLSPTLETKGIKKSILTYLISLKNFLRAGK